MGQVTLSSQLLGDINCPLARTHAVAVAAAHTGVVSSHLTMTTPSTDRPAAQPPTDTALTPWRKGASPQERLRAYFGVARQTHSGGYVRVICTSGCRVYWVARWDRLTAVPNTARSA